MQTIKTPTSEEYTYLKKVSDNDPRKCIRKRATILLTAFNNLQYEKIAEKHYCSKKTIYIIVKNWNNIGLASVVIWRRTKTWMSQVKRRRAVEKLIMTSPTSLGMAFTNWSLEKLSKFFINVVKYPVSPTTLSRDLKILGLSYKKVQDTFLFKPVDYDVKRAWLRFLEHYCPPSWRVIYIDEKGPIYPMRYAGHTWSFAQRYREVRQPTKRKLMFLGGYDPKEEKLTMIPMEGNASTYFCDAFDILRLEFLTRQYSKLLIILDNARIHSSSETLSYFNDDERIEYFFLPAYSPELNPIEICFRNYCHELLANASFHSPSDVIEATNTYCDYYRTLRREIYA
ncbi:MAG: IS630 family transposase [Candidatus Thorarchaeota archaeon]